ncbi:hypothetical protein C0993_009493 [Termitomyces sp. T159_Od127]|nr:hypothetical protein C0993_009493 [Termitomyces sp. T159_Od127]
MFPCYIPATSLPPCRILATPLSHSSSSQLHTLEDFTAHSNWCEITLGMMGHHDVFLHVGDQVRVQAPNGQWVAPIVTGTFGSSDFFHSLLGEAGDHLSQASVTDLNKSLDSARARSTSTSALSDISGEVINSHDQYEVFNDPRASDPTHSFLSKDHFRNTVGLVQKAWDDNSVDVRGLCEEVLQAMFHPYFHNPNSKVQREMLQEMRSWVADLGTRKERILARLTRDAVRGHENSDEDATGLGGIDIDSAKTANGLVIGNAI